MKLCYFSLSIIDFHEATSSSIQSKKWDHGRYVYLQYGTVYCNSMNVPHSRYIAAFLYRNVWPEAHHKKMGRLASLFFLSFPFCMSMTTVQ